MEGHQYITAVQYCISSCFLWFNTSSLQSFVTNSVFCFPTYFCFTIFPFFALLVLSYLSFILPASPVYPFLVQCAHRMSFGFCDNVFGFVRFTWALTFIRFLVKQCLECECLFAFKFLSIASDPLTYPWQFCLHVFYESKVMLSFFAPFFVKIFDF